MGHTFIASVLPYLRSSTWTGWDDAFSMDMPGVTPTAYTPRLGFWVEPGRLLRRVEVGGLLQPESLLRQAIDNLARRACAPRVVAMSRGFLGLFKKPIEWVIEDHFAAEHVLLEGLKRSMLAHDERITFAAPFRGVLRMHAVHFGDRDLLARHESFERAAETASLQGDVEHVSPVTFWTTRAMVGTRVATRPADPRLARSESDPGAADRRAGAILLALLDGTMPVAEAMRAWPESGVSVPAARSYLEYFAQGLDGRGFRDPQFDDLVRGLAQRLARAVPSAPAAPDVFVPVLRPAEWAGLTLGAWSQPLLEGAPSCEVPRVGVARLIPEGIAYLSISSITAELERVWPGRGAPPSALLEHAVETMRVVPARWLTHQDATLGTLLTAEGELITERILDRAFMRAAHEMLGAKVILAAMPAQGELIVLPGTASVDAQRALAERARARASKPGDPAALTPLVLEVRDGVPVAVAA